MSGVIAVREISESTGVSLVIRLGSHFYTLLVSRNGWVARDRNRPCDSGSMTRVGYMQGAITAD
jgi:hypothetical protein